MSVDVFVDTNVLVYARHESELEKQSIAAEWLRRLWLERRGRTSVQVLSEYYVVVTRKLEPGLARADAWDDVEAFFSWKPQDITPVLLRQAREVESRYHLSWWDAMVVASAQMQSCAILLSEDLQDGLVCDSVTIRSPFTTGMSETRAAYAVSAERVPRHRPRGRPRRTVGV